MASITAEQARHIASLKREAGLTHLSECLGWQSVDGAALCREDILLDYLYDALQHGVRRGFPWNQACAMLSLAYDMIPLTKGKNLPEAIQIYKRECRKYEPRVSSQNLKIFTDYFFQSFMTHFKLYQYVFNKSRDLQATNLCLHVETPPEPQPFLEAKDIGIWEYEQKIEQIAQKENERRHERRKEQETGRKEGEEKISEALQDLTTSEQPLDREKLMSIIQSVASAQISAAGSRLTATLEETVEELEFKIERNAVQRPAEMGPPPRHKTKTPASAALNNDLTAAVGTKSGRTRGSSSRVGKGK